MHHFRTTFFIQRPSSSNGLDSENPKGGGRPLVRRPPTAFPSLLFRMTPSESAKRPRGPASVELPQVQDVVGPAPLAFACVAPVLMAGGGIVLIGLKLIPLLAGVLN